MFNYLQRFGDKDSPGIVNGKTVQESERRQAIGVRWYRRDRQVVTRALGAGERPEMATTLASGRLDEFVALHEELSVMAGLDALASEG